MYKEKVKRTENKQLTHNCWKIATAQENRTEKNNLSKKRRQKYYKWNG